MQVKLTITISGAQARIRQFLTAAGYLAVATAEGYTGDKLPANAEPVAAAAGNVLACPFSQTPAGHPYARLRPSLPGSR